MSRKKLKLYSVMEILSNAIGEDVTYCVNENDEIDHSASDVISDSLMNIVNSWFDCDASYGTNITNITEFARDLSDQLLIFAADLEDLEESEDYDPDDEE